MQYTNHHKLPQYLVDWLKNDDYDYSQETNTVSATGLLKPVRATVLTNRHHEKLEMDVIELVASRYGNALHDSIEKIKTPFVFKEERVFRKITVNNTEYTVSGKYDILIQESNGTFTLRDIKSTSTWAYILGGKDDDYRFQLSVYRWILAPTHVVGDTAYIDFLFTDWQSSKAKQDKDYPQSRLHAGYKIKLYSLEEIESLIVKKLKQINEFSHVEDDKLPECTKEELWSNEDTYAVYKIGNKKATKVCNSMKEAVEYKESKSINGFVQHRPGKVKRCKYCPALPFCNQGLALDKAGMIEY